MTATTSPLRHASSGGARRMVLARFQRAGAARLAAAVAAFGTALFTAHGAWSRGFPVDDAWIHMVYGLGLVRDRALAYNGGIPATGATSPLWAFVAALAHVVVGARGPSMAAATALKAFGALAHAMSAALAAECAQRACVRARLAPVAGLVAGLLVAFAPILAFAAVSGMEVGLCSALLLYAFLGASRGDSARAGAAIGFAFLTRPESAIVAPAAFVLLALAAPRFVDALRRVVTAGAIAVGCGSCLLLRNEIVSGRPLPATFYVKAAPVSGRVILQLRLERGFGDVLGEMAPTSSRVLWIFASFAILVAVVAAIGGLVGHERMRRWRRAALVGGAAGVAGIAYAASVAWIVRVISPEAFYFQRYFAPAIPLLVVGAVSGASTAMALSAAVARALSPRLRLRVLAGAGVALGAWAVVAEASGLAANRARYAKDVADIDGVQVAIGHFVAAALPPAAVVWSMDAGAVRYWGERFIVDLGELNTPELFQDGEVRPGFDADAIVALAPPAVRVVAHEGTLAQVDVARAPSWPPPPNAPEYTQVVWRCRPGLAADEAGVQIVGYPDRRVGRCRAR